MHIFNRYHYQFNINENYIVVLHEFIATISAKLCHDLLDEFAKACGYMRNLYENCKPGQIIN